MIIIWLVYFLFYVTRFSKNFSLLFVFCRTPWSLSLSLFYHFSKNARSIWLGEEIEYFELMNSCTHTDNRDTSLLRNSGLQLTYFYGTLLIKKNTSTGQKNLKISWKLVFHPGQSLLHEMRLTISKPACHPLQRFEDNIPLYASSSWTSSITPTMPWVADYPAKATTVSQLLTILL